MKLKMTGKNALTQAEGLALQAHLQAVGSLGRVEKKIAAALADYETRADAPKRPLPPGFKPFQKHAA